MAFWIASTTAALCALMVLVKLMLPVDWSWWWVIAPAALSNAAFTAEIFRDWWVESHK